ncbi:Rieske 2Fe-2S domain-containing protein [Kitasatospora sp. NPDC001540]|uniref:Rieske 2Fe-2S domain-containing protein n=1 Tax=Kitasatospora sp. NPDC001540 TaxID=3364014 RepID=UPI0036B15C91
MDAYHALADRMDAPAGWTFLDPVAERIAALVQRLPLGPARDALHGVWLGHPLHPALAQLPVGCWTAATLLEATGGDDRAVRRLTATGLAALPPVLLAGWVDWSRLPPAHRRIGLVHAAGAATAALLHAASLRARRHGRPARGRLLGLAGTGTVGLVAALGGHLAYHKAAGAAHAEAEPRLAPSDWHSLGATADIPENTPVRRQLGDVPVVVVRTAEDGWTVLADRYTHMAASLAGGEVVDGCLECPLHHSRFRLSDGRPARGPATAAQPRFETRVLAYHLEARPVNP